LYIDICEIVDLDIYFKTEEGVDIFSSKIIFLKSLHNFDKTLISINEISRRACKSKNRQSKTISEYYFKFNLYA